MKKFAIFMLMLLVISHAEDYVAINSMDGRDVLSGAFYANVKNIPVKFIPYDGDSSIFVAKVGEGHDILLIQSELPVSSFVESDLKARNNSVEVYTSIDGGKTNLELAKRSGATSFIVVDSAFSDSALSVLPYAAMSDSYVLLSNNRNADDIAEIVSGADRVIIYGYVDEAVKDALKGSNPEYIGEGEDKYADNVEIVEKTMQEFGKNVLVTVDGTFLEEAMALGEDPILLTGRLVPQVTYDFIKDKARNDEISHMLLVGNELVVPIHDMRERMKKEFEAEGLNKSFSIIVKFAQVLPSEGTGVLVLDTFPMPAYKPNLEIGEIFYNTQSEQVMVSLDNIGEGPAYYVMEVRVKVDGQDYEVFGGEEVKLIERGEQTSEAYDFDMSGIPSGEVSAVVLVKFGGSKTSLDEFMTEEGPLASIEYTDESDVLAQSAKYEDGALKVTLRNNGDETAYAFTKVELIYDGKLTNVSSADVRTLEAGSLFVEEFPLELSNEDLEANKEINVFVDFGAREGFLIKHAVFIVDLQKGGDMLLLIGLAMLVVVVIVIATAVTLSRKGKKKKGR